MNISTSAKFIISDKKKKDQFISIFQLLKSSSSQMNITMGVDELHIQGMDKSHVCLFDLVLHKDWFHSYEVRSNLQLCFDVNIFCSIINIKSEDQKVVFYVDSENNDIAHIHFISTAVPTSITDNLEEKRCEYDKYFKLPLLEYDYEEMLIPTAEYDIEVSLPSKKISDDLQVKCSSDWIDFITSKDSIEMCVRVMLDDVSSFSIALDENGPEILQFSYSLIYIHKLCVTNKLSSEIDFSLSGECPMKIYYDLGNKSSLYFYIAPKMIE